MVLLYNLQPLIFSVSNPELVLPSAPDILAVILPVMKTLSRVYLGIKQFVKLTKWIAILPDDTFIKSMSEISKDCKTEGIVNNVPAVVNIILDFALLPLILTLKSVVNESVDGATYKASDTTTGIFNLISRLNAVALVDAADSVSTVEEVTVETTVPSGIPGPETLRPMSRLEKSPEAQVKVVVLVMAPS